MFCAHCASVANIQGRRFGPATRSGISGQGILICGPWTPDPQKPDHANQVEDLQARNTELQRELKFSEEARVAVEERRALQEKQARLPGVGSGNASRGASRCLMMSSGGGREELAERIAEQALGGGLRSGSIHGSDASISLAGGMGQASYSLAETTVCFQLASLPCNRAATRIQQCCDPIWGDAFFLCSRVCDLVDSKPTASESFR
jgi:hypothetical protein